MSSYLHRLSAFLFFLLGTTMFLAYILWHNNIVTAPSLHLMLTIDLPLLACGLLYGGTSVYLSVNPDGTSKAVKWFLGIPLAALFLVALVLKF